ncbi:MAG: hypothetical protein K9I74_10170 [Bacteroidales bacterium]|nr:hypothetical protein [Bacteroidales bacterium]
MRKIILYSIVIAALAFFSGCEEPDEVKYDVGDGFSAQVGTFTVFDNNVDVNFYVANPDVNQVTVKNMGCFSANDNPIAHNNQVMDFGTLEVNDGVASKTFSRSELGFLDNSSDTLIGAYCQLKVTSQIEANPTNYVTITMNDPLEMLEGPYVWGTNDEGEPTKKMVDVYHNDDEQYIKYTMMRNGSSIDNMTVEQKVNADGTWSEMGLDLNTQADNGGYIIDSLSIVGNDFNVDDTVHYRFTAEVGSYTTMYMHSVVVNQLTFDETGSFTLDQEEGKSFDLVNNQIVYDTLSDASVDSADVTINYTAGNFGLKSDYNAEFVKTSNTELYQENDKEAIIAEYEDGVPSAMITNLTEEDVVIYRTTRDSEEYYGILQIEEAMSNASDTEYHMMITYRNN